MNVDDLGEDAGGDEHAHPVDAGQRRAGLLHQLGDLGAQAGQFGVDLDHPLQSPAGHRSPDAVVACQQRQPGLQVRRLGQPGEFALVAGA